MIYNAYGKQCRINTNEIFTGTFSIRAEYDKDGTWAYIDEPTLGNLSTKAKCDAEYQKALDSINASMLALFGEVTEPSSGIARIEWLIDNKTIVENNNLKIG